ncbi:hypothetical protein [uncultured Tenacibaculum sp.]|uniref:hypothetical protein n=1 Tax=uncultured Tenacibaculum sp. TaxID=174713 RepID=UPI002632FB5D|nr:hypothetical protein [uncultured Tenacibaculum sp.]
MKKSILNVGKALNKAEQREINGGRLSLIICCDPALHCCRPGGTRNCRYSFSSRPVCI